MTAAEIRVTWVDDQVESIQQVASLLQREGIVANVVESGNKLFHLLSRGEEPDVVIVDLEMPHVDGIEVIRRVMDRWPGLPVVVVSAYLYEPQWRRKLRSLDCELLELEKPWPMIGTEDFDSYVAQLRAYVHAKRNPFELSLGEFLSLNDGLRLSAVELAHELSWPEVSSYFSSHPEADWVLVAGSPGNVIQEGRSEQEPVHSEVVALAEERGQLVLLFSRGLAIEDFPRWASVSSDGDAYPTLCVEFRLPDQNIVLCGHFDTGSPLSFISYEECRNLKIVQPLYLAASSEILWGGRYSYFHDKLKARLVDEEENSAEIVLDCRLVRNWEVSPLVRNYTDRVALFGRRVILENGLCVELDGRGKRTRIVGEE